MDKPFKSCKVDFFLASLLEKKEKMNSVLVESHWATFKGFI